METKGFVFLLLIVMLRASLLQCANNGDPGQPPSVKEDPSFSEDIQPIFNSLCASSNCHGTGASGGPVLLEGQAYGNLVNVQSSNEPVFKRVKPDDADSSYAVIKLEGRQTVGQTMPLTGNISSP